jgi:TolB-like protein
VKSLVAEIRRRNVHRVALAYIAASWLLIQVVETLFPVFGFPDEAIRIVVIVLAVGFIPAVILSWAFEWTPEGFRRDAEVATPPSPAVSRRFDRVIIVLLALAVTYLVVDKFVFTPAPADAREASIAVLAFDDLSPDRDQAWFAEGMSEELMNLLAEIPALRVAGRTSAFSFRGKDATIPEIADALGVAHVVEGSVRKFEDRVRITVQLLDGPTDTHLWSETYDRDFDDIFRIQDDIAAIVVERLQLELLGAAPTTAKADPQAYALYLQARSILNGPWSDEGFRRAKLILERAIDIDPDYIEPIGLLARIRWLSSEGDDVVESVRAMIDRGLGLDPDNGAMLSWKAFFAMVLDNDLYTAARYLEHAHDVDPTKHELVRATADMAAMYGRPGIGITLGKYILERDPLCTSCYGNLAKNYVHIGDYAAAEQTLQNALAIEPDDHGLRWNFGQVLLLSGRPEEALDVYTELEKDALQEFGSYVGVPGHLETLHTLGMQAEYDALLPKFIEFHEQPPATLLIAQQYAWAGEADLAFEWLDKHDREVTYAIRSHLTRPWYRKLHDDPRWQALLERYQMTEADFEAIDFRIRMPPGASDAGEIAADR